MMCMILSPNCCAVTIFEYSSTDVTLLPSLFVSSERTRWFAKQMAKCGFRPPKASEEEEIVWTALFPGKVCICSDEISNVIAILGRKSTARLKVNRSEQKHEVATIEREFKI